MLTRTRRGTGDTAATTAPSVVDRSVEIARPTQRQVIDAIVAQIGCTRQGAHETVEMLRAAVKHCRAHPGQPYYIPQAYLDLWHGVFAQLVPPRQPDVVPGSARALTNRLLLDGPELNILHTSNFAQGVKHCTVHVTVNVV